MMLFFSRIAQSGDCFHLSAQSGDKTRASARNCGHWSAAKVNLSTIAMARPYETSAQTVDPKTRSDVNIHNASLDWGSAIARGTMTLAMLGTEPILSSVLAPR